MIINKLYPVAFKQCENFTQWSYVNMFYGSIKGCSLENNEAEISLRALEELIPDMDIQECHRLLHFLYVAKNDDIDAKNTLIKKLSSPQASSSLSQNFLGVVNLATFHFTPNNSNKFNIRTSAFYPLLEEVNKRTQLEILKSAKEGDSDNFSLYLNYFEKLPEIDSSFESDLIHTSLSSSSSEIKASLIKSKLFKKSMAQTCGDNELAAYLFLISIGDLDSCKALLELYPDLTHQRSSSQRTALHIACQFGQFECVKWLLENHPDPNSLLSETDSDGLCPLAIAVQNSPISVIEHLINYDQAQLEWRNCLNQQNLLHLAVIAHDAGCDRQNILKFLVNRSPDLLYDEDMTDVDADFKPPLAIALRTFSYQDLKVILVPTLFDINKPVFKQLPPVAYALSSDRDSLASSLIIENKHELDLHFRSPIEEKTYFHLAAKCPESLQQLIAITSKKQDDATKTLLNQRNGKGWLPYHSIVAGGSLQALKLIEPYIENKWLNRQAFTHDKKKPIMLAIEYDKPDMFKKLLQMHVIAKLPNQSLNHLLFICAENDSLESLLTIIEHPNLKPHLNISDSENGLNLLQTATKCNAKKVVNHLMEYNSTLYADALERKKSPLIIAVQEDKYDCLEVLLHFSVAQKDESTDERGYQACHLAVEHENKPILEALIKHKILLNARIENHNEDAAQLTPLLLAAKYGKENALAILVNAFSKEELAQQQINGMNAAHLAAIHGHCNCIKLLKNIQDFSVSSPRKTHLAHHGYTPVCLAAKYHQNKVLKTLIEQGAKLNHTVHDEYPINITALVIACLHNNFEGADIIQCALAKKNMKLIVPGSNDRWNFQKQAIALCQAYNSTAFDYLTEMHEITKRR